MQPASCAACCCSWLQRLPQLKEASYRSSSCHPNSPLFDPALFVACLQVVALAATIGLDLGTTLLFTGLYNVASGFGFRIPMCVQPMKTIAAVALAAPGRLAAVDIDS